MKIKSLLVASLPILTNALKNSGSIALKKVGTVIAKSSIKWPLRRWKKALLVLIFLAVGFLIGWQMKLPEIVIKTKVVSVTEYVERFEAIEVRRPHNCALPAPTKADQIATADRMIAYLNSEYRVKYIACLDSLQ